MRALFGSLTTRGRSFVAAGGAAMVCGLAIPETGPGPGRRAAHHPAPGVRADRAAVPLPPGVQPQTRPATGAGRAADRGHRAAGERLAAAHRHLAGRGRDAVLAGQPAPVRARRDRAGRQPGAQLPDPFRHPRQVHHRPAAGAGGGRVRAGGDQPVVQHDQHAGGHPEDLPAAAGGGAEQLARRGRRRDADDIGDRRGRRGAAGLPERRRAAPGALAVDGALRRADGPPGGTPVAQQRVGVPGHPPLRAPAPGPPPRSSSRSARRPRSART